MAASMASTRLTASCPRFQTQPLENSRQGVLKPRTVCTSLVCGQQDARLTNQRRALSRSSFTPGAQQFASRPLSLRTASKIQTIVCKDKDKDDDRPTKIKKKDKKQKKDFKREEIIEKEEEGEPIGDLYPRPSWEGIERSAHVSDDAFAKKMTPESQNGKPPYKYKKELQRLQAELVKVQEYVRAKGLRIVTIFEGRDAAGKGGIIKRIAERMSPRTIIVNALGTPSDREKTQWYFQRYVSRLPAAGEWVIFDRSWYNRAGVEKVMGFCTDAEYKQFLKTCPLFENLLIDSGIILIKYWVSVSASEQDKRFKDRLARPEKRWKLSPIDLYARSRWSDYSYAKDVMFSHTDTKTSPWHVIDGNDKKAARLNAIKHLLSVIPYEDIIKTEDIKIPPKQEDSYERPALREQTFVPQEY